MKVAVFGVAGSGKTKMVDAIMEALDDWESGFEFDVIEHPTDSDVFDGIPISIGQRGTFRTGLMLSTLQWGDRTTYRPRSPWISDGSDVERVAYALLDFTLKSIAIDDETRGESTIAQIGVEMLSALAIDSWVYDHAFYLPLTQEQKDHAMSLVDDLGEGDPTPDEAFEMAVDELIPGVLEDLRLDFVTLEGSHEERLGQALELLKGVDSLDEPASVLQ